MHKTVIEKSILFFRNVFFMPLRSFNFEVNRNKRGVITFKQLHILTQDEGNSFKDLKHNLTNAVLQKERSLNVYHSNSKIIQLLQRIPQTCKV